MARERFTISLIVATILTVHILNADGHYSACFGQTANSKEETGQWALDTSFGIPVRIAFDSVLINKQHSDRVMFLFIEDRYCSRDILQTMFTTLAKHYQYPESLKIEVYSDPEMLRRAIARYKTYPSDVIFPDTPEGVELEKKIRGNLYIPKTSWARARYYRESRDGSERFFYKPNSEKVEMIEVVLKPRRVIQYTGNLHSDLFLACKLGDKAKAESLMESRATIDFKDKDGETPLVHAVRYKKLDIVSLLLTYGAYVDAKNKYNQTPLTEALCYGYYEIVRVLLDHNANANAGYGQGISPLHLAVYKGDANVVEMLLLKGADPNAVDEDGNTPLFEGVRTRKSRIVSVLLQSGASVHIKNKRGKTPLTLAKELGDEEIIKLLKSTTINLK